MFENVKNVWIYALKNEFSKSKLKSGNQLRKGDKYDSLGVLCDVFATCNNYNWEGDTLCGQSYILPSVVQNWAGMKTQSCMVFISKENKLEKNLSLLDLQANAKDFEESIDFIEQYWREL